MKTFQIICTIIVGLSLVFNLSVFLIRKRKIRIKNQVKMRIKKIKVTDYLNLFFGFVFIGLGLWDYKTETDFNNQNIFWIILGVTIIISGILNAGDSIVIDSLGIKDYRFLSWDSINSMRKNQHNPTEIIFESDKKNLSIDFYNISKIDEFKSIMKQIKPDIIDKYRNEI